MKKSHQSILGHGRSRGIGHYHRVNKRRYENSNGQCSNCHKFGNYSQEHCNATNDVEENKNLIIDKLEVDESTLLLAYKNEKIDGKKTCGTLIMKQAITCVGAKENL
jgi:hypothetical protein